MFLVTVCISLARRVSCAGNCFALICCLSSSFSFFFLSFVSLILLNLACRVLICLAFLIFSFFALAPANFAIPHFLGLCNKINDYAAIGLLFLIYLTLIDNTVKMGNS